MKEEMKPKPQALGDETDNKRALSGKGEWSKINW